MNRKLVLAIHEHDVSEILALFVTLLVGICHMLPISETIKLLVSCVYLCTLLCLSPVRSVKYLMFVLSANELLDIGNTSLTMILMALFSLKQGFLFIKEAKVNSTFFLSAFFLAIFGTVIYITLGIKDALVGIIKHILFLFYTAKVLEESRGAWTKLYVSIFRYIALGVIYFTMLSIAINGVPSLSVRFTPASEITINFFAITCAIAIVNLLYGILYTKANTRKNLLLIGGCSICGLLTQSRTFILAVAIGVILLFAFTASNYKLNFLAGGLITGLILMVIYANIPTVAERIDKILFRFLDPSGGDISNGRYDLWSLTITSMLKNPVYLWFGAGDYRNIGAAFDDKVMVAHNMFLETWVIYGVVGCIVLLVVHVAFVNRFIFCSRNIKPKVVTLVPLIVMLCSLFYSHHFIGRSMSMVFAFSFLPIVIETSAKDGVKY